MIQAIQQMLSRRSQLAALMVMAALVAAAFAALSTSSAQEADPAPTVVDNDEVTLAVHVYFPNDTDGVFVAKSGSNAGVDRVPVAIELRATVPYTGTAPTIDAFGTATEASVITAFEDNDDMSGFMSPDPTEADATDDDDAVEDGVLLGITGGATDTQASGSRISLSGGNKFNRPSVATLYFANDTLSDVATTTEVDESIRTRTNPAVVLDCLQRTVDEDGNDNGVPLREGNRPRTDQNADAKKTVTQSCFVVLAHGVLDNTANDADDDEERYATYEDPEVFIAGLSDGASININARLNLGRLGISWGSGDDDKAIFGPAVRSGSATLRINNGENEVAAAALSLGINTAEGTPCSGAAGAECPSQITTSAGGSVTSTNLTLAVSNSEGAGSNWNGIRTIEIQTSRGDIRDSYGVGTANDTFIPGTNEKVKRNCFGTRICQWTGLNTVNDPWDGTQQAGAIGSIVLKSTGTETGTATVTARVQAINGSWVETNAVEVRIAGPAKDLALAPAASNVFWAGTDGDNRDRLTLVPTATDASGEAVTVTRLHPTTFTVTGPDNRRVANSNFNLDNTRDASEDADDNDLTGFGLTVIAPNTATGRLKPGTHKVEVRLDGTSLKKSIEFTVVGPAADDQTTLVADPPEPAGIRTPVMLTATVNDAAGNPVADGTNVTFSIRPAGGGTAPALLDTTPSRTAKTKGGVASRSTIVVGSGLTVVTATADTVVKTRLIPVGGAAQATEKRDITGLSSLNGFANWQPDNTVTAGELYRGLRARGVGLLWKYNPDGTWLRFGLLADGVTPIPGSDPDFEIQSGDTLFIGGRN